MMRKLIATGIAVIVSLPLIPVLKKGMGHLTGTDAPMVFPAQGWNVAKRDAKDERASADSSATSLFVVDTSASMSRMPIYDNAIALETLLRRVPDDRYLSIRPKVARHRQVMK